MGLEPRGENLYIYRKVRVGNKVKSVYVGPALKHMELALVSISGSRAQTPRTPVTDPTKPLFDRLNALHTEIEGQFSGFMYESGYHKPNRGPWRKRRC